MASYSDFAVNPSSVDSGQKAKGTITLTTPAPPSGLTFTLSSGDTSIATVPNTVTVAAGKTTASFDVTTLIVAADSDVTLTSALGTASSKTATLHVKKAVQHLNAVTVAPTTVSCGVKSQGTITINLPAPAGGVVVNLKSSNTAVATVPASVTVPENQTSVTFDVTTKPCNLLNKITLTATWNSQTQTTTLTVNPAQLQAVSVSPTTLSCGKSSTGTITLDVPSGSLGRTVSLKSSNTAVATVPASVKVAAGATSVTFAVTTKACNLTNKITLTASLSGVSKTTTLTVNPAQLISITPTAPSVKVGKTVTETVTLDVPAGSQGRTVTLTSDNTAVATVPASVKVAAGKTTVTFAITGVAQGTANIKGKVGNVTKTVKVTVTQ